MIHEEVLVTRARLAAGCAWNNKPGETSNQTEDQEPEVRRILRECADALHKVCTDRERLEVQLAGCGAAAMGAVEPRAEEAKPGDYGWSPSYGDVVTIRHKLEEALASDYAINVSTCVMGVIGNVPATMREPMMQFRFAHPKGELIVQMPVSGFTTIESSDGRPVYKATRDGMKFTVSKNGQPIATCDKEDDAARIVIALSGSPN